ncbi:hypothetical protein [Arenimonas sp.]|uniref:hypothetical protein n=1 Tax=Arenimonas sp. TaxID=1872635 RepID=UPI0039E5EB3F
MAHKLGRTPANPAGSRSYRMPMAAYRARLRLSPASGIIRVKRQIGVAFLLLVAFATHADSGFVKDGSYWAAALKDERLRNEAVCRLIMRGEYADLSPVPAYREKVPNLGCRIRRVVDATAQANGAWVVFLESEYSDDKLADGSRGGHFLLFDAYGRIVPVFARSNSLEAPEGILRYGSAGSQALVQIIDVSSGPTSNVDVEVLHVIPATIAQRPILSLMLATPVSQGKDAKPARWAWRTVDNDRDGQAEFELGRTQGDRFSAVATYRYSTVTQRYEGPEGALAGDFQRLPDGAIEHDFNLIRAFGSAPRDYATKHRAPSGNQAASGSILEQDPARKQFGELMTRFKAARAARDQGEMEASLDATIKAFPAGARWWSELKDEMMDFGLLERGRCDAGLLADNEQLKRVARLRETILICKAAKLPRESNKQIDVLISEIFDGRAKDYGRQEHGLYDKFARQPVINRHALELMAQNHLGDTRFEHEGESALIEQILAGRADNVRLLLESGYDADAGVSRQWRRKYPQPEGEKIFYPSPMLPLQAVRQSLATRGEQAIEVAKVLLAAGANPHRLKSYPQYVAYPPADPVLQVELDRLLADASKALDPVSTEFLGYRLEYAPEQESLYARFLVGNGSDKPLSIPAWKDGDDYRVGGLNAESHLEWRMLGGSEWQSPLMIEHGWSPSTKLIIPPGESHELLFEMSTHHLLNVPEGMRYRLWFNTFPGQHHSNAFQLNDPRYEVESERFERKRAWDIDPECVAYVEGEADDGHDRPLHQHQVIDKCEQGK